MPDVADDVKYSEICNKNENYSCRLSSVNVNCTCVCSIKLYWKGQKGKKEKYSEIKDILCEKEDC